MTVYFQLQNKYVLVFRMFKDNDLRGVHQTDWLSQIFKVLVHKVVQSDITNILTLVFALTLQCCRLS